MSSEIKRETTEVPLPKETPRVNRPEVALNRPDTPNTTPSEVALNRPEFSRSPPSNIALNRLEVAAGQPQALESESQKIESNNQNVAEAVEAVKFSNRFPEDQPRLANVIPQEDLGKISGKFAYVVTEDKGLVVGRNNLMQGHIDLSGGKPVLAAGEVKLVQGDVKFIDNSSGHYRPSGESAKFAAEQAFAKAGFSVEGKYKDKEFQ